MGVVSSFRGAGTDQPSRARGALLTVPSCLAIGCLVATAAGCGASRSTLEKRIATLQEELSSLHEAQDRLADRLGALEARPTRASAGRSKPATETPLADPSSTAKAAPSPLAGPLPEPEGEPAEAQRPRLAVVRLEPSATPEEDADAPPVLIRGTGEKLEQVTPTAARGAAPVKR